MEKTPYKEKSYKLFMLWLILFISAMCLSAFWCYKNDVNNLVSTKITLSVCVFSILFLSWVILKSGRIYIYNGVSYDEAKNAGEARRHKYALAHFKIFLRAFLIWLVWVGLSLLFNLPFFIDIIFFACDLVYNAITTIKIKL